MALLAQQSRNFSPDTRPAFALPVCLLVLAALTVAAKYIAPILYYVAEGLSGRPLPDVPVLWDFWWPLYLISGGMLYQRARRARSLFIVLAGVRVLWSIVFLTLFIAQPSWSFWRLQWLFCEVAALAICGIGLAAVLMAVAREDAELRSRPAYIAG